MSAHYIYLACKTEGCGKVEQIYTGEIRTYDFPDCGPDSFEGEFIYTPCNDHAGDTE